MKPFAQWTEAEVVDLLRERVPETWGDDEEAAVPPTGNACYVALWFRSAWEWHRQNQDHLPNAHRHAWTSVRKSGEWWAVFVDNNSPASMKDLRRDPLRYASSVHALGAACLLAAGKPVPA